MGVSWKMSENLKLGLDWRSDARSLAFLGIEPLLVAFPAREVLPAITCCFFIRPSPGHLHLHLLFPTTWSHLHHHLYQNHLLFHLTTPPRHHLTIKRPDSFWLHSANPTSSNTRHQIRISTWLVNLNHHPGFMHIFGWGFAQQVAIYRYRPYNLPEPPYNFPEP